MKLDTHTEIRLFEVLKPEWNDLLERSPMNRIFSTWEWNSTWWEAYHPGELWVVTCRDDDGRLIGIAPWFIDEAKTVRAIGCEDVTDYVDVIVDQDHVEVVLDCFAQFLERCHSHYDMIQLCNIPEESPTYVHFASILEKHQFTAETEQQEVCPLIELPDDWEGYLNLLDKKQRHELRRKLRRAGGEGQDMAWYTVGSSHDLRAEMDKFLKLMAESDEEKREFLQNEQHVAFFNSFVPIAFEKGWLQLNILTVNDEPSAAYLNFDYHNEILVYNSGLSYDHASLSPGIILLAHNIRHAIENKYRVFNFLRGNETYKYRMGGQDTRLYQLTAKLN